MSAKEPSGKDGKAAPKKGGAGGADRADEVGAGGGTGGPLSALFDEVKGGCLFVRGLHELAPPELAGPSLTLPARLDALDRLLQGAFHLAAVPHLAAHAVQHKHPKRWLEDSRSL